MHGSGPDKKRNEINGADKLKKRRGSEGSVGDPMRTENNGPDHSKEVRGLEVQ